MIAFWEFLGLYRCLLQRVLCHARKMPQLGCLNVEIFQTGRKLQSYFVKIDE
jgi:hypothetical protein